MAETKRQLIRWSIAKRLRRNIVGAACSQGDWTQDLESGESAARLEEIFKFHAIGCIHREAAQIKAIIE